MERTNRLGWSEIMRYIGFERNRAYVEGERVLDAGQVMLCGITSDNNSTNRIEITAFCISTSDPRRTHFKINLILCEKECVKTIRDSEDVYHTILKCECMCKAGSNKCKHVVAVLMYIQRHLPTMERLSCTDIEQAWGVLKKQAQEKYDPRPLLDGDCTHFKKPVNIYTRENWYIPEDDKEKIREGLISAAPNSEAAHLARSSDTEQLGIQIGHISLAGNKAAPKLEVVQVAGASVSAELGTEIVQFSLSDTEDETYSNPNSQTIDKQDSRKIFAIEFMISMQQRTGQKDFLLCEPRHQSISEGCLLYYKTHVEVSSAKAINICLMTMSQSCELWKKERKVRITGSVSYSLYTYERNCHSHEEWNHKLCTTLNSTFNGNKYTQYGKNCEKIAINCYESMIGTKVHDLGLVINPSSPWLAFSPDGISQVKGTLTLIEIKSPDLGTSMGASEVALKHKYIDSNGMLNKKCAWYGQIQLGLELLKIQQCHLLIYSSYRNEVHVIPVLRDEIFLKDFIPVLNDIYFKRILQWLIKGC